MSKDIIHWGNPVFTPKNYQQCTKTVMDNICDPNITFDENGICNYWHEYRETELKEVYKGIEGQDKLNKSIETLKTNGKNNKYDCIVGISGGVDSTFIAGLLNKHDVKVLLVHFDYGWNSELAVKNIENIVTKTGFDLETVVMDWEEFKDLQRSYFKASVLDLDVPADHMIFGALYRTATKYNIKHIISGHNVVTEALLPKTWNYRKFDIINLKKIHHKFGTLPLVKLKSFGYLQFLYFVSIKGIKMTQILNYIDYNKAIVKQQIIDELDWVDYGGKHYESIFTRFYQGYILPNKFGIDKRKAHLSNLICSGQITKNEALKELENPPMDSRLAISDKSFVAKKLGWTAEEFDTILNLKNVPHESYGTDEKEQLRLKLILKILKPLSLLYKKLR